MEEWEKMKGLGKNKHSIGLYVFRDPVWIQMFNSSPSNWSVCLAHWEAFRLCKSLIYYSASLDLICSKFLSCAVGLGSPPRVRTSREGTTQSPDLCTPPEQTSQSQSMEDLQKHLSESFSKTVQVRRPFCRDYTIVTRLDSMISSIIRPA